LPASGTVRAAIEILDAEDEDALTFRSLADRRRGHLASRGE
jgi:hypothetical protein